MKYLEVALSAANFVIKDLHRTSYKEGFLFSYSPLQGNDTVFNASYTQAPSSLCPAQQARILCTANFRYSSFCV